MSYRLAGEPVEDLELAAVEVEELAVEPGLFAVTNLEKYTSEGGEFVPA
jgi:hypothetical protein